MVSASTLPRRGCLHLENIYRGDSTATTLCPALHPIEGDPHGGRAASKVAVVFGVSWRLGNTVVLAAAMVALNSVNLLPPARLGVDGHRYHSVRWFKNDVTGSKALGPPFPWANRVV